MTLLFSVCCLSGLIIEIANVVVIPIIVTMTLAARCSLLAGEIKKKRDMRVFRLFVLLQDI